MKIVAMERISYPNGILGRGVAINRLMYVADDYVHDSNSAWVCYDRIDFCSDKYFNVINKARAESLYIRVEYFSSIENGDMDAYELYLSSESAFDVIKNKDNFVYKFELLSRAISEEYKMFG